MSSSTTLPPAPPTGHPIGPASRMDSSSSTFLEVWTEALRKFEAQSRASSDSSRRKLAEKLLRQLNSCNTIDTVVAILSQGMDEVHNPTAGTSRWTTFRETYLKSAIQVILVFNDALAELAGSFPVVPGGKAIFVAFGVLLEATHRCDEAYDALFELFEGLKLSMDSLGIRIATPSCMGPASKSVAVLVLVNLLDVLTIALKLLPTGPLSGWFKVKRVLVDYWRSLTKNKDIVAAMQRMRELTSFETRAIAAETQVTATKISEAAEKLGEDLARMMLDRLHDTSCLAVIQGNIDGMRKAQEEEKRRTEEELQRVREEQRRADETRILERLDRVDNADLRAQSPCGCLAGTRVDVLDKLQSWSRDDNAPRIYWLNGMAGTGKSAIARSFGQYLYGDGRLGGSFFCSRGTSADRMDVNLILPTLARALATVDPEYCSALALVIQEPGADLHPNAWRLEDQVERLFRKPFYKVAEARLKVVSPEQKDVDSDKRDKAVRKMVSDTPCRLVMLIDALDETEGEIIRGLLDRLTRTSLEIPLKFFLTSRPEKHIRETLNTLPSSLHLHEIGKDIVKGDILRYVCHRFSVISKSFTGPDALPSEWPLPSHVHTVARLAGTLFIHAFTTTEYIAGGNPVTRLQDVLNVGQEIYIDKTANPLDDLDRLYKFILASVQGTSRELSLTWRILTAVLVVREPLDMISLANLLGINVYEIRIALRQMHSVLHVPAGDDIGAISTLHASFGDFLRDPQRAPESMLVHLPQGHCDLATRCIAILKSEELHFNMSCFSPTPRSDKPFANAGVRGHLKYACLHWSHHISGADECSLSSLMRTLGDIFPAKFTFWAESCVISGAGGTVHYIIESILTVSDRTPVDDGLRAFFRVAQKFLRASADDIAEKPPSHVYLAALFFIDPDNDSGSHVFLEVPPGVVNDAVSIIVHDHELLPVIEWFALQLRVSGTYDDVRVRYPALLDRWDRVSLVLNQGFFGNGLSVLSPQGPSLQRDPSYGTPCVPQNSPQNTSLEDQHLRHLLDPARFFSNLAQLQLTMDGLIIVISVHSDASSAIVLCKNGDIIVVQLPRLTFRLWTTLQVDPPWHFSELVFRHTSRVAYDDEHPPLFNLWITWHSVVEPLLQSLNDQLWESTKDCAPHITWCLHGINIFHVPFHGAVPRSDSANSHTPIAKSGPLSLADFAVSSYTPSLAALFNAHARVWRRQTPKPAMLIISRPEQRMPGISQEVDAIQRVLPQNSYAVTRLDHAIGNDTVSDPFPDINLVHFTGHNLQGLCKSVISKLMKSNGTLLEHADLAFISACDTAISAPCTDIAGGGKLNVAEALLALGFSSVVGTIGPIADQHAPTIAEYFYLELVAERRLASEEGRWPRSSAYALASAVNRLRQEFKDEEDRLLLVPYVHFGV